MRVTILITGIMLFIAGPNAYGQTPEQASAIKQTVLDYIEGWYEGNAERMERALHPDLAKRAVFTDSETGKHVLRDLTKPMMVRFTREGGGTDTPENQRNITVTILDVLKNTATVKVNSAKFIDYLHIVNWNGQWMILNVVWEDK